MRLAVTVPLLTPDSGEELAWPPPLAHKARRASVAHSLTPPCPQCPETELQAGHQSPTQPPWQPHSAPLNTMATAFHYPQCCGNHFLPPTTPGQPHSVNHCIEAATFHYPQQNGQPVLLTTVTWQPHSPGHNAMGTTFCSGVPTPWFPAT